MNLAGHCAGHLFRTHGTPCPAETNVVVQTGGDPLIVLLVVLVTVAIVLMGVMAFKNRGK